MVKGRRKNRGKVRPMEISNLAGNPADPSLLINVPRLVTAYYTGQPAPGGPKMISLFIGDRFKSVFTGKVYAVKIIDDRWFY
jgi:hypothetical protein